MFLAKLVKDSEITIITVIDEIMTPPVLFPTSVRHKTVEYTTLSTHIRDLQKEMRCKTMDRLEEIMQKYQNSIRIEIFVSIGSAEVKIVEYANRKNVDLIVMGSKGLKGISRLIMGSVSRTVSEKVKCTVMIVK